MHSGFHPAASSIVEFPDINCTKTAGCSAAADMTYLNFSLHQSSLRYESHKTWDKQAENCSFVSLFPMPKTKKKSKKQLEEAALIYSREWRYFFYLFPRWVYLKMGSTPLLKAIFNGASMNHDQVHDQLWVDAQCWHIVIWCLFCAMTGRAPKGSWRAEATWRKGETLQIGGGQLCSSLKCGPVEISWRRAQSLESIHTCWTIYKISEYITL